MFSTLTVALFETVTIRTVTIPSCEMHAGLYRAPVKLRWTCPRCGKPRGEPVPTRSYDGSHCLIVDGWVNPCGHIDYYCDVRTEAKENGLN